MTVISRLQISEAVEAFLGQTTGMPVALLKAPTLPDDELTVIDPPYAIIYPLSGGGYWGPTYGDPEDAGDFVYQVTSVALRDDQCQWMADKVREAIVGRDIDGIFLNDLSITGAQVADRASQGGPGTLSLNGRLYSLPDTYVIRVVPEDQ